MASYFDQVNGLAPKVWYRFNETAGTPVNSGSLTTTGGFANLLLNEQTDVDGRAIYFNGNSAYIALNAWQSFELFNDKSFTIETWFKLGQIDTNDRPMYRFSGPAPVSNTLGINVLSTTNGNGKIQLRIAGLGNQTADAETISTNTYNDNKWHHTVVAVNTTSLKWYIDGNLETTKTLTTSTLNWDDYTSSGNLQRLIGTGRSNTSETISQNKYRGWLDEFAIYGYELSAQNVLDNFNAGASVQFADIPGTASALAVMPAFSTECVQLPAPMTASSLFVDTYVSNFDYVDGVQKLISDISPQQWYKFDATTDVTRNDPTGFIKNYGSGGQPVFSSYAVGDAYQQVGPAQETRLELRLGSGTGALVPGFATTTTSDAFTDEISDNNFGCGIWFKMPSGIDTSAKQIFAYLNGTNVEVNLQVVNKKVQFNVKTSVTTYTHNETNDISENEWHLAVIRLDLAANTLKYYLDGTEVFSDTAIQGTRNTPGRFTLGKANANGTDSTSSFMQVAHYFVGTYSDVSSTFISNLWNAGTRQNQAKGVMTFPVLKFDNKYDQVVASLNPIQQVGFNDISGTVLENVGSNINTPFNIIGTSYVRGTSVLTKNRYGFNFTNKNTYVAGAFNILNSSYSDNTQTISVYAKIPAVTGSDNQIIVIYGAGNTNNSGIGLSIMANASGPYLAIIPTTNPVDTYTLSSGSTSWYGDWHLYTAVRDGTTTRFYIDGEEVANGTYSAYNFTNLGQAAIGGGETVWLGQAAATVDKYIDEFASFDYALSAQQITEMYQAIEIDRMNATNATFPMPTNIAGTGNTQTPAPMTASSEAVEPVLNAETNELAIAMDAFAEFILPNFGGNVVIDANYGHTAATADAELPDPQFQIGDFHSADHMDASALFVHPISTGGGRITVSTAVGSAEFVMPGIVTIKGARVFAEPARANAFIPLPPAYLQLTDDQWYVRLFAQHAEQNIEPAFVAANLPNTPSTQIAKTVLKFFEDVTSSITVGNGYLENNLEEKIFKAPGSTDTSKVKIYPSIAPNLTPTPALYTGYFDDFGRKAVRVENIEFAFPEEIYKSKLPFSLEFSIKTTKANQIIAQGKWASFLSFQKQTTGFGLYDGKLYLMNSNTSSGVPGNRTAHPANPDMAGNPVMIGRKNIADGKWHHIIIQIGYTDNRIQFWCDGQLDRQQIGGGEQYSRLYIMGSNNGIATYQSDFETSGWSYDKQAFIEEQDVDLNYIGYLKYEPIAAEPMKATITMTDNNTAAGNRGRAIVFYFWPEETDRIIAPNPPINSIRGGSTLSGVTTDDYFRQPPQEWYGWDLFPIDVTGRYVSELVKPEAYGVNNIKIQEPSFFVTGVGRDDSAKYAHKVNIRGYFTDPITDARRYIDVFNDIDLSQFDAIFFKNYPEETAEKDAYTREDFADQYFNLRERELFDKFLESLRKGLDTGISLFVTNDQLALDLGIVDRVEDVTDVSEGEFTEEDDYVISRTDLSGKAIVARDSGTYPDLHKNNRHQVVNTLPNLTNDPGYIWTDWFYFENDDTLDFGGANRPYTRIENRPNGLQVGDKFIISDDSTSGSTFRATPIANVKAGKVITKFADTIYRDNTLVDNPYKDYATTIAVEPGTILKGRPTVGKIFVNFTERFYYRWNGRVESREYFNVDLIQDEFINAAYNDGEISLAKRDALLASPDNLDRRMEAAIAANNQNLINTITNLKYWNNNGDYVLTQKTLLDDPTGSGVQQDGLGKGVRRGRVNRVNKKGSLSTQTVSSSLQWFSLSFAYQYERAQFVAASMLTRGIRWLSDKIVDDGLVNRVEAMKVSTSELPMPKITGDKPASVNAERMLAIANIIPALGYALADVSNTTLPLTANANFGQFVKSIKPDVFTASATFRDNVRTLGVAEDQIVVYINHVDPILYIREEIIK